MKVNGFKPCHHDKNNWLTCSFSCVSFFNLRSSLNFFCFSLISCCKNWFWKNEKSDDETPTPFINFWKFTQYYFYSPFFIGRNLGACTEMTNFFRCSFNNLYLAFLLILLVYIIQYFWIFSSNPVVWAMFWVFWAMFWAMFWDGDGCVIEWRVGGVLCGVGNLSVLGWSWHVGWPGSCRRVGEGVSLLFISW